MKKIIITLVVLALLGAAGYYGFYRFRHMKNSEYEAFALPKLRVARFQITNLTADETNLTVNLMVRNGIPGTFTADSLRYKIYTEGKEIARDQYPKSITLTSGDSVMINVPLKIKNRKLIHALKKMEMQGVDSVWYKMEGSAVVDLPIIDKKKFTYTDSVRGPALYIPTIEIEKIKIRKLDLKGASLDVQVRMENPNAFPIDGRNTTYLIKVDDEKWADGTIKGDLHIPAHGHKTFDQPVELNFKAMRKTVGDMIRNHKELNYYFETSGGIISKNRMIEGSKFKLTASGKVKALIEAAKEIKKEGKGLGKKNKHDDGKAIVVEKVDPKVPQNQSDDTKPKDEPKKKRGFGKRIKSLFGGKD
ncbi:MAG: LEA type 2 family protein [Bacteroidota bacterium]